MKLQLSLLSASLLFATASNAATVELKVQGTIVPPSCTISLSNNGAVDYGQVDLATLNDAPNALPTKNVDVGIVCASAAKVATSVTEDRPGTSMTVGNAYFGLNNTSNNIAIGEYQVFAENGLADTVTATVISSANGATWISPTGGVPVEHGTGQKITSVGTTAGGPASATTSSWTLRIESTLNSTSNLAITGTESIDGQMTLTLMYL